MTFEPALSAVFDSESEENCTEIDLPKLMLWVLEAENTGAAMVAASAKTMAILLQARDRALMLRE